MGWAPGFGAGLAGIGGTAQIQRKIRPELEQQHAQHTRPLRLRLAVTMEGLAPSSRLPCFQTGICRWAFGWSARASGGPVGAARQCLQELARILEIAPPEQGRAFTGELVGCVGAEGVVG